MYLMIGGTGYLGSMIAQSLLTKGCLVRALVKEGSSAQPLVEAGAQVVTGDLQDPASLEAACQGVQTIISTASAKTLDYGENMKVADVAGYQNLIWAARAAGVDHMLFISALGADPHSPVPYLAAKGQIETDLRASGIDFTIFRPSYFLDFWFMGLVFAPVTNNQPVWVLGDGSDPHWPMVAKDVAEFVVKAATGQPSVRNRLVSLPGPQPLSLRDAALVAGRILGKPVSIKTFDPVAPPSELSPLTVQLLSLEPVTDFSKELAAAEEFGVRLTTLDDFLSVILASPAKTEG